MNSLFISWDGPAQNYMESLFLPIYERVQSGDLSIRVLQFTWGNESITESVAETAAEAGIGYTVTVRKDSPLAEMEMNDLRTRLQEHPITSKIAVDRAEARR